MADHISAFDAEELEHGEGVGRIIPICATPLPGRAVIAWARGATMRSPRRVHSLTCPSKRWREPGAPVWNTTSSPSSAPANSAASQRPSGVGTSSSLRSVNRPKPRFDQRRLGQPPSGPCGHPVEIAAQLAQLVADPARLLEAQIVGGGQHLLL